jgi:hypothetical protein
VTGEPNKTRSKFVSHIDCRSVQHGVSEMYLSVDENKTELVEYFVKEWRRSEYAPQLFHRYLFITRGTTCTWLTSIDGLTVTASDVPSLKCWQEADTRLLLHAVHAGHRGYKDVVIKSPDTDVAISARALSPEIPTCPYCRNLLGLHAITGCDSTSAFKGRGKETAFDTANQIKE